MGRNTMSFALPEGMRDSIDTLVSDGSYGNTSEYLRELIRRDQREQATQRLRDLIADGLASGEGREATDDVIAELRERALGADAGRGTRPILRPQAEVDLVARAIWPSRSGRMSTVDRRTTFGRRRPRASPTGR